MNNERISDVLKIVLDNESDKIEQIYLSNSIYKEGTYKISKDFKNTSNCEIEQWANNILIKLNSYEDLNKKCDCDFRLYNDGNEKWNTGSIYLWIK